jgi:hypothetical protein
VISAIALTFAQFQGFRDGRRSYAVGINVVIYAMTR